MRRLGANRPIYSFSPKNKPALTVDDGETVVVETKDCFSGLVRGPRTHLEDISMDDVNPATGPIRVRGMVAGDVLSVGIQRIKLGAKGVIMCSPELGLLAEDVRRSRTKIVRIRSRRAVLSKGLEVELRPHVGVIGVSPAKGEYPTFHPGDFGGNLDTAEACEGSTVYLPTFVDGGDVALGDVHAAMGDGEICGTGIETSGEVTVSLSKAQGLELKRPMIETPTEWIAYAAAKTLDEAAKLAARDLVSFVASRLGTDFEEAYMLASVAADLRISQVVDPLMAARMCISKRYL